MTDLEQRIRRALEGVAGEAPMDAGLAGGARRRAGRRRRTRVTIGAALAVAAVAVPSSVLAGLGEDPVAPGRGSAPPVEGGPVADGWREVSWRDVTVEVPPSWTDGARSTWCADDAGGPEQAKVERPTTIAAMIDCDHPRYTLGLTFSTGSAAFPAGRSGRVWQYGGAGSGPDLYLDGSWLGHWYDHERLVQVNAADRWTVERILDSVQRAGWSTVEHGGVSVDLPPGWAELDQSGCRWPWPRFGPEGGDPCDPSAEGLTFYNEATYDPIHGPGVRRAGDGWAGYTVAGDYAVHVRAADEELARRMLESAR